MKKWCFTFGLKILVCILVCGLALGYTVMLLWNWLIPDLFNVKEISFLQALGLLALARILLGGFKGWRKGCCSGNECGTGGHKGYWKKRWEAKLANMSPEEREKVKASYKKCCGIEDEETQQKG